MNYHTCPKCEPHRFKVIYVFGHFARQCRLCYRDFNDPIHIK